MATVGSYAAHAQDTVKWSKMRTPQEIVPFTVVVEGVNPPATHHSFHIGGDKFACFGNTCTVNRSFNLGNIDVRVCNPTPACRVTGTNNCATGTEIKIGCTGDLSSVQKGGTIKAIVNVNGCSCTLAP